VERNISPHIPVWDKSARSDGTFSRADFVFDRDRNVYICQGGKLLRTTGTLIDGGTLRYRAAKHDCDVCTFKMQCSPNTPMRQIPRELHQDARDVARALAKTEAFERSRRERKKVEMCFAHMKRIFRLEQLRLRGLSGGQRRGVIDRNRAEPAASRQVPFPTATISASLLCSLADHQASRSTLLGWRPSARDHKLTNAQIRCSSNKQPGHATQWDRSGHQT
jgi:hypothetical protein